MTLTLLERVRDVEESDQERLEQDGFCPFCACRVNPGEKVCLDCLLDFSIGGTD
jgi:hypothetical protein